MLSIQELRSSTTKELLQELEKMRKEMVKVRLTVKTKHDKDIGKVKKTKHYIAQILTILKEVEGEEVKKSNVKAEKSSPAKSKDESEKKEEDKK